MVLRVESWNCSDNMGIAWEARSPFTAAGRTTCPKYAMLSPSRANHLVSWFPRLSLNFTRSFATNSNEGGNHGRPQKSAKVASKEASEEPLASSASAQPQPDASDPLLAASLNRYHSLPPLPPIDNWLSHFAYVSSQVRDRISIRAPASAISVAHSFINSKKTSTNNPKVIVEAFPGVPRLKAVVTLLSYPV
jgi:hypothetical protein